ncbi:FAD-linked oxidoreductase, partial [Hygrophoropsis aurantiaca]
MLKQRQCHRLDHDHAMHRRLLRTRPRRYARTAVSLAALTSAGAAAAIYHDADHSPSSSTLSTAPLSTLLRTYLVYTLVSIPPLVDAAPSLLSALLATPGLRIAAEAFVRRTFFAQFVGGETAEGCVPVLGDLRREGKGALFAYSVEVPDQGAHAHGPHSNGAAYKRFVDEMIHSIDVAADFDESHGAQRKTWVAIKLTALLPSAEALARFSAVLASTNTRGVPYPGTPRHDNLAVLYRGGELDDADCAALRELHSDLRRICTRAQRRGVRVIVDAEHTWYQPAIDAFGHALMMEFNKLPPAPSRLSLLLPSPLIYVTYQAYLRRTPAHLAHSLASAREGGYALGVKLVRGAYHGQEEGQELAFVKHTPDLAKRTHTRIPEPLPPVWSTKAETDACFDACAEMLLRVVRDDVAAAAPLQTSTAQASTASIGGASDAAPLAVLFGTHNRASCLRILDGLVRLGLASPTATRTNALERGAIRPAAALRARLAFGQLYGMSDALSDELVRRMGGAELGGGDGPWVIKYVPYGALTEVMPYLSRRAIENRSVLGGGGGANEQ